MKMHQEKLLVKSPRLPKNLPLLKNLFILAAPPLHLLGIDHPLRQQSPKLLKSPPPLKNLLILVVHQLHLLGIGGFPHKRRLEKGLGSEQNKERKGGCRIVQEKSKRAWWEPQGPLFLPF
jgi:hypothetical protein